MSKTPTKAKAPVKPAADAVGPTGRRRTPVNIIDIRGMTQGLLHINKTAKSTTTDPTSGGKLWPAKCKGCGETRDIRYSDFARGRVRSCGKPACVAKLRKLPPAPEKAA